MLSTVQKTEERDFPGGPVVGSLPTNSEDVGSSPGLGDPMCCGATMPLRHKYWSLSALEPVLHRKRSHRKEKSLSQN